MKAENKMEKYTADVIVIGGGGSGLAAAIEAASLGRRVILLEKGAQVGGTTAKSVGSITATNTPQQLRHGILDSPQEHFEDLKKFNQSVGLTDNDKLCRLLVENVPETIRWLMSMGIEFHGPVNELPHRKPRMHVILPNSKSYIFHLKKRAESLGVEIRKNTRAINFLMDSKKVVGVRCENNGEIIEFYSKGGIVLASGDYAGSAAKRLDYFGEHMRSALPVNPLNTGDGHDMVEMLGGKTLNKTHYLAGIRFQAPPSKWIHNLPPYRWLTRSMRIMLEITPSFIAKPFIMSFLTGVLVPSPKLFQNGAILLNKNGERFSDELNNPGPKITQQPDQIAYIFFDGKLAKKFDGWPNYVSTAPGFAYAAVDDYRKNRKDIFHEAHTLEKLAKKIGFSIEVLKSSISQYNQTIDKDKSTNKPPIEQGPYICIGPVRFMINFTDGGIAVSESLEVLDADDRPIHGLFAAGNAGMGGVLLEGHGHHLGWAFTSGRLAGRKAAHLAVSEDLPEAN